MEYNYNYGNLPKEKVWELESAFASNYLEGLDNPKINQYLIDLCKSGLNSQERTNYINNQLKSNYKAFLAQFN